MSEEEKEPQICHINKSGFVICREARKFYEEKSFEELRESVQTEQARLGQMLVGKPSWDFPKQKMNLQEAIARATRLAFEPYTEMHRTLSFMGLTPEEITTFDELARRYRVFDRVYGGKNPNPSKFLKETLPEYKEFLTLIKCKLGKTGEGKTISHTCWVKENDIIYSVNREGMVTSLQIPAKIPQEEWLKIVPIVGMNFEDIAKGFTRFKARMPKISLAELREEALEM